MNVEVPLADGRRIEVLANGLPLWQGSQAAVDGGSWGCPKQNAGDGGGEAAARKRRVTYPELANARRCKLVVIRLEVGGRFVAEAVRFVRGLAKAKAREAPAQLRGAARLDRPDRFRIKLSLGLLILLPPLGDLLAARGTGNVLPSRLSFDMKFSAGRRDSTNLACVLIVHPSHNPDDVDVKHHVAAKHPKAHPVAKPMLFIAVPQVGIPPR